MSRASGRNIKIISAKPARRNKLPSPTGRFNLMLVGLTGAAFEWVVLSHGSVQTAAAAVATGLTTAVGGTFYETIKGRGGQGH